MRFYWIELLWNEIIVNVIIEFWWRSERSRIANVHMYFPHSSLSFFSESTNVIHFSFESNSNTFSFWRFFSPPPLRFSCYLHVAMKKVGKTVCKIVGNVEGRKVKNFWQTFLAKFLHEKFRSYLSFIIHA